MVSERHRRQYLDAMGISLWVARRPLPNALDRPLPAVEEAPAENAPVPDHSQRLHALIDDAEREPAPPAAASPEPAAPAAASAPPQRSARALLDDPDASAARGAHSPQQPAASPAETDTGEKTAPLAAGAETDRAVPLRFTLQVAALEGRWLLLLPRERAPSDTQLRLIEAILAAAGARSSRPLSFQRFDWPMMEGVPVSDPLDEAKQGLRAFLAGRRARGWVPEQVLQFGRLSVLEQVLEIRDARSHLLELPLWQGPALECLDDAAGRRELWRRMADWPRWWQDDDETSGLADRHDEAGGDSGTEQPG